MMRHIRKAIVIAIAITVVMWAWEYLKRDTSTLEFMNRIKKQIR